MNYHPNVFSFFPLDKDKFRSTAKKCTCQYLRINSEQKIDEGMDYQNECTYKTK